MQIQLTESGPPMWFLGQPKSLRVSLNFDNPGPVEVDFKSLTDSEQQKLLIDIRDGILACDVEFQELYQTWVNMKPAIPEPPREVKEYLEKEKKQKAVDNRFKIEAQREKKEKKFQERCQFLHKKSLRALKAGLKDEKDMRLFRTLLDMELARKKPRAGQRDYLQICLKKGQKEIVLDIDKHASDKPLSTQPRETIQFSVIESEQELVNFAMGDPLGKES